MVKDYIFALRSGGSPVNGAIVAGVVHAMLSVEDPSRLHENGGDIDCYKRSLIQSLYRRYNLVKRRGTSGRAVIDVDDMNATKSKFVKECEELILAHGIPPELIVNYDETGLPICPVGEYTMEVKGAKTVQIFKKGTQSYSLIIQSFIVIQVSMICIRFLIIINVIMLE